MVDEKTEYSNGMNTPKQTCNKWELQEQ